MMDPVFLDNLRRMAVAQNIFGQPTSAPASPTMPQGDPTQTQDMVSNEPDYIPEHDIMDAYKQSLLKGQPQHHEMGTFPKILAATFSGLANLRTPQNALPMYNQLTAGDYGGELQDWKNKVEALRLGSALENQTNINTRTQQHQERQDKIAGRNIDVKMQESERKRQEAEDRNAIAQQRANIAQQRANVYAELSKGAHLQKDQDGKVYVVRNDGSKVDTGIDDWSPRELEEYKHKERMEEETQKQKGRIGLEETKQTGRTQSEAQKQANRVSLEKTRIAGREEVGVKGTGTGTKEMLPTQKRVEIRNRAQQVRTQRADWAPYIKITGNDVVVADPKNKDAWFGLGQSKFPTAEMRAEIVKAIYPEGEPKGGGGSSTPPANPKKGDKFTWPNGNTGVFDGKGWVRQ